MRVFNYSLIKEQKWDAEDIKLLHSKGIKVNLRTSDDKYTA